MRSSTRQRVRQTSSEQRILDATRTLLADGESFANLPVERIISAAGVSRSTFYGYFADKNELVLRVAEPFTDDFTALADTWWQRVSVGDSWEVLAELMGKFISAARTHRDVFDALTSVGGGDPIGPSTVRATADIYAERMAERLAREQSQGVVSADVLPLVTARFIVTATFAAIRDHLNRGDATQDAALARTLGHAFWFTMYGR